MKLGVVLPRELTFNPLEIIQFAKEAENLGYTFIIAYDHVILPRKDTLLPHDQKYYHNTFHNEDPYYESLTLLAAIAANTNKVALFTGVLVSPQRQTVLLAKQAAMVDLISRGRLILGLGVGWNPGEYQALGKSFQTRGKAMDQQILFLRKLWTQSTISHTLDAESVREAGIYPLPVQRPIPIWIGGQSDAAIKRTAKLADGWIPMEFKMEEFASCMNKMYSELKKNNRKIKNFGIIGKINPAKEKNVYKKQLDLWKQYDISHLVLSTNYAGDKLNEHLKILHKFRNILQ